MSESLNEFKKELKNYSRNGKFVFLNGKWWYVPSSYDIITRKYRLGFKIIDVPVSFKLKKHLKHLKNSVKNHSD